MGKGEGKGTGAEKGFDEEMGARPLARTIQEYIKKPIADELLFGSLKHGGIVRVLRDKDDSSQLAFEYIPEDPKTAEPDEGEGDKADEEERVR